MPPGLDSGSTLGLGGDISGIDTKFLNPKADGLFVDGFAQYLRGKGCPTCSISHLNAGGFLTLPIQRSCLVSCVGPGCDAKCSISHLDTDGIPAPSLIPGMKDPKYKFVASNPFVKDIIKNKVSDWLKSFSGGSNYNYFVGNPIDDTWDNDPAIRITIIAPSEYFRPYKGDWNYFELLVQLPTDEALKLGNIKISTENYMRRTKTDQDFNPSTEKEYVPEKDPILRKGLLDIFAAAFRNAAAKDAAEAEEIFKFFDDAKK
jgi:hypothetical protein